MAHNIDKIYQEAVTSGLLPGVSVFAGDNNGRCFEVLRRISSDIVKFYLSRATN